MRTVVVLTLLSSITTTIGGIIPVSAQETSWIKTYGGNGNDQAHAVQQTTDGGYIVAGWTSFYETGSTDVYLLKTDFFGDTLWTKTYGTSTYEKGNFVRQTPDAGYIIVGEVYISGYYDIYVVKTDSQGNVQWTNTYGGIYSEEGYCIQPTWDGGYIVIGTTYSYGWGAADMYVLKLDAFGDTLWTKTYGGLGEDEGSSIQPTADSGYILAGFSASYSAGAYDVYLVKTDSLGMILWRRTYGGFNNDYGLSVQQTSDGGYIIAGSTNSFSTGDWDIYLIKTNAEGDTLWTKRYGDKRDDFGYSVQQTTDEGYIVAGRTKPPGTDPDNVYLIKTDSQGDTLWTKIYGGSYEDVGYSVQQTMDEGFIVAGYTSDFEASPSDVVLIKTDPEGWVGVAGSAIYNLYEFTFPPPHPNPFNPTTVISYELQAASFVTLGIYDLSGRRVTMLVEGQQTAGTHEATFNGSDLASGIYLAKLTAGENTAVQKLVLLK